VHKEQQSETAAGSKHNTQKLIKMFICFDTVGWATERASGL